MAFLQRFRDNAVFEKKLQSTGELGERMEAAFAAAFEAGAERALIIGSDCPDLSPAILDMAFAALHHHDFVVGPVPDGGYYLLGMRRFQADVFRGIAWSTETVRSTTLAIIQSLEKSVFLLPELRDVDTEEDWAAARR
jgi:uncharacterized protein